MIVERAFAAHVATLVDGLHAFKDELAWAQAGEPWPCLLVSLLSLRPGTKGSGLYDHRALNDATGEYEYRKFCVERYGLRLTIRAAATSGKSGATLVAEVVDAIKGLVRRHSRGQSLDVVDTVTGTSVHIEKLQLVTISDQGPLLSRVPFEAQQTVDVALVVNWPEVATTARPFSEVDMHVDVE